jgi:hypothetical protein
MLWKHMYTRIHSTLHHKSGWCEDLWHEWLKIFLELIISFAFYRRKTRLPWSDDTIIFVSVKVCWWHRQLRFIVHLHSVKGILFLVLFEFWEDAKLVQMNFTSSSQYRVTSFILIISAFIFKLKNHNIEITSLDFCHP